MPESSAIAGRPVAAARGAGLPERIVGEALPRLGRQLDLVRERIDLEAGKSLAQLAELVLVAGRKHQGRHREPPSGGELDPTADRCASRSRAIPPSASASSSSSEARESGVRSAVACTSTSPPSPVITTFASTSAVESSA